MRTDVDVKLVSSGAYWPDVGEERLTKQRVSIFQIFRNAMAFRPSLKCKIIQVGGE